VGRLALSLHQAIKNRRMALPDDEVLLDELVSVRLRKNSLGIYRLDHDSGQHDDQAVALALGVHYLLDADGGAEPWIRWARQKAIAAGAVLDDAPAATPELRPLAAVAAVQVTAAPQDVPLEGVILDPVTARKRARDEAFRAHHGVSMFDYLGSR